MTTNNHPAHDPVSLDRLHQIREILSKAAAQSDGGNLGYAMADAVKVIDGAIAAFGAEPVAWKAGNRAFVTRVVAEMYASEIMTEIQPLYTAKPAPVVTKEWITELCGEEFDDLSAGQGYRMGWNACRAAMLQSLGNSKQLDEVGSWNNHRNTPTAKPAINTVELLKRIEGMEVSVDVSTCDTDAGHRYFGTVTEISELDTAKNGYILLVQDAKPNFKQAGNSPVIPDGWIPVGDRMPQIGETVALIGPDVAEPVTGYLTDYGEFVWALEKHSHSILVSHWMPFPAVTRQEGK